MVRDILYEYTIYFCNSIMLADDNNNERDDDGDGDGDECDVSGDDESSFDSSSSEQSQFVAMHPSNPDYAQLFEDVSTMMDDYIRENIGKMSSPTFHDELTAYLFEQLRIVFFASVGESVVVDSIRAHSLIYKIIDNVSKYYFGTLHNTDPHRFVSWRSVFNDDDDDDDGHGDGDGGPSPILIGKVVALQQQQNQTEQRTAAWYARRHSLITASAAWKAFGSDSVVNQLIYEKCKPYDNAAMQQEQQPYVNVESPLHWGQKYEFLSAALYQRKNNTRIGEFGCIQHSDPRFSFIGGSPDGINTDESSPLFGRMVEIKNIVNRDITGIPKEDYWIQMQIQMEVCDMDAGCDFVETRFKEYDDAQDYYDDVQIDYAYTYEGGDGGNEIVRGTILYFIDLCSRKPHYEYMPFEYLDMDTQDAWITNTISRFDGGGQYLWIRNIYWKLDQYSCVFVPRNKMWFTEFAAPQLTRVWQIIERERVSGYAHRAPKKRVARVIKSTHSAGCNLDLSSINQTSSNACDILFI